MRSDPRLLDFSAAGLSAGLALFELIRLIASEWIIIEMRSRLGAAPIRSIHSRWK